MDTISSLHGQPETSPKWRETSELRTHPTRFETPINKGPRATPSRARLIPYAKCNVQLPVKRTAGLAVGTQARLIAAAYRACGLGYPINALLSVRWSSLLRYDDWHPLRAMDTPERIRHLVELVRKWLTRRGLPPCYFWVREKSDIAGEHWHLALHLPKSKRKAFAGYLETLLIEPLALVPRSEGQGGTRGEFACSIRASWHLGREVPDGKPHFVGYWIAAYLGKGEPSQRVFRGKLVNNAKKPERGRAYGGTRKTGRYDVPQGDIVGTTTRKGRFDISRFLK